MKPTSIPITMLLLLLLCCGAAAQKAIPWFSADIGGAESSTQGSPKVLYTSFAQPAVARSTNAAHTLQSGFLVITIVPSGAAKIVAQSSVDFGSVTMPQTEVRPLTVQNAGAQPLNISATTISPATFAIQSGGGAQTIPPGGSVTMQLAFTPASAGAAAGSLVITSNASNAPTFTVALSGTGVATAPKIQLSAQTLDFGAVNVGGQSLRSVTITNAGNAALAISGQTLGGANAADFSIMHQSASPVAAQASDYIEIRFSPAAAGVKTALLTITSNDPNNPTSTVALTGSASGGAAPHIAVSASSLDFGTTASGGSVERSLVVSNSGTASLTLSTQTVTGTYFSLGTAAAASIAPGGNATAKLLFQPTADGTWSGSFAIASNDPNAPVTTVSLTGKCGTVTGPRLTLNRSMIDFGQVPLMSSKEEELTLRNIGSSDLVISQQVIAGTDALHFSIVQVASTPVNPGGSTTVRIRHLPISAGPKVAVFRVQTNDPGAPTTDVPLLSIVTGVEQLSGAPLGIELRQNYPNPFNPSTSLEYATDIQGLTELTVYDAVGRRVAVLDRQDRPAGWYRAAFDASMLPSGIYVAVLRVTPKFGVAAVRSVSMIRVK